MLKYHKKLSIITLGIALLAGAVIFVIYKPGLMQANTELLWGYRFSIVNRIDRVTFLAYEDDKQKIDVMRMESVPDNVAKSLISDKVGVFQSLFEPQRVGYTGQHTQQIQCPEQYKPAFGETTMDRGYLKYFSGFANSRYTMGACSDEDISYKADIYYLYCTDSQYLYEIELFVPIQHSLPAPDLGKNLSC